MESQFTARMMASMIRHSRKARAGPIRSTLSIAEMTTMAASTARLNVTSGTADQKAEKKHQTSIATSAGGTTRKAFQPR